MIKRYSVVKIEDNNLHCTLETCLSFPDKSILLSRVLLLETTLPLPLENYLDSMTPGIKPPSPFEYLFEYSKANTWDFCMLFSDVQRDAKFRTVF